jgi:8-oxo-dGTP pyrophosphatase MutT (NUDIX family)
MTRIDTSWYERLPGAKSAVSAGGVVARIHGREVLIALVHEVGYPKLVLPKGHVEVGEDLEEAARREIAEEAGLTDLELVQKLGQCTRMNLRKTEWKTTHYYLYCTREYDGAPTDTEHHYELVWQPLEDLDVMFWPDQRDLVLAHAPLIRQAVLRAADEDSLTAQ